MSINLVVKHSRAFSLKVQEKTEVMRKKEEKGEHQGGREIWASSGVRGFGIKKRVAGSYDWGAGGLRPLGKYGGPEGRKSSRVMSGKLLSRGD